MFAWSHCVAAWRRSAPIVDETQVSDVPEPSESRYWCISVRARQLTPSCHSERKRGETGEEGGKERQRRRRIDEEEEEDTHG